MRRVLMIPFVLLLAASMMAACLGEEGAWDEESLAAEQFEIGPPKGGWNANGWNANGWNANGWNANGDGSNPAAAYNPAALAVLLKPIRNLPADTAFKNWFNSTVAERPDRDEFMQYFVRCALRYDQSISFRDAGNKSYTWTGSIGLAPNWFSLNPVVGDRQIVSACMLALRNGYDQHHVVSLRSPEGIIPVHASEKVFMNNSEARFFGDFWVGTTTSPRRYACKMSGAVGIEEMFFLIGRITEIELVTITKYLGSCYSGAGLSFSGSGASSRAVYGGVAYRYLEVWAPWRASMEAAANGGAGYSNSPAQVVTYGPTVASSQTGYCGYVGGGEINYLRCEGAYRLRKLYSNQGAQYIFRNVPGSTGVPLGGAELKSQPHTMAIRYSNGTSAPLAMPAWVSTQSGGWTPLSSIVTDPFQPTGSWDTFATVYVYPVYTTATSDQISLYLAGPTSGLMPDFDVVYVHPGPPPVSIFFFPISL